MADPDTAQGLLAFFPVDMVDSDAANELGPLLAQHLRTARDRWPSFAVTDEAFVRHVANVLPKGGALEGVRALCAADLYLATACLGGDKSAMAVLDRDYLVPATQEVCRQYRDAKPDEIAQTVRERLLLSTDQVPAKISQYEGRAPLSAWMRVIALRTAISQLRKKGPRTTDQTELMGFVQEDLELDHVRRQYAADFREAFQQALEGLPDRDRTILRFHVVDGLSLDEVARVYNVHRTTSMRWLQKIREDLFRSTKTLLAERLQLSASEFDSLAEALLSKLSVSIDRILAPGDNQIAS